MGCQSSKLIWQDQQFCCNSECDFCHCHHGKAKLWMHTAEICTIWTNPWRSPMSKYEGEAVNFKKINRQQRKYRPFDKLVWARQVPMCDLDWRRVWSICKVDPALEMGEKEIDPFWAKRTKRFGKSVFTRAQCHSREWSFQLMYVYYHIVKARIYWILTCQDLAFNSCTQTGPWQI